MIYNKVTHVLFDLDGLLLGEVLYNFNIVQVFYYISYIFLLVISDSEKLYTQAFTTVCGKYGKSFTWELKATLLGFQGHECADKIIQYLDLPITREEFMAHTMKEYEVLFPSVELMPGNLLVMKCAC